MPKLPLLLLSAVCICQTVAESSSSGERKTVLPIEVIGGSGITEYSTKVVIHVPSLAPVRRGVFLKLRVHGLPYDGAGKVSINGKAPIVINNREFSCSGLEAAFGCLFRGLHTVYLKRRLQIGDVVEGENTITFTFAGTDGVNSGYRILSVNFVSGLTELAPASQFIEENPDEWKCPDGYCSDSDIAAGRDAWENAPLTEPDGAGGTQSITAKCSSCHARDGRDLKYFNYSNNTIMVRSKFHGLSDATASQIAAYIRSLDVPNPGRPWNPPYQPGPGLDARPASHWSAGAGIDAVLPSDAATLDYFAPNRSAAEFSENLTQNMRETPIAVQLHDWNHWLPMVYPDDAFPGAGFHNSKAYTTYIKFRENMSRDNPAAFGGLKYVLADWVIDRMSWMDRLYPHNGSPAGSFYDKPSGARKVFSVALWQNVKRWELDQEFGLDAMCSAVYGDIAEPRCIAYAVPFRSSPSNIQIPPGSRGIQDGSVEAFNYVSFSWYQLQVTTNAGYFSHCDHPVDWGYMYGFISGVSKGPRNTPQAGLLLLDMLKALQVSRYAGPPGSSCSGWHPDSPLASSNSPSRLVSNVDWATMWKGYSSEDRAALVNAYMTNWAAKFTGWPPSSYISAGWTSASEKVEGGFTEGNMASRMAASIPRLRYMGMSDALAQSLVDYSKTLWNENSYNWDALMKAACRPSGGGLSCTSD